MRSKRSPLTAMALLLVLALVAGACGNGAEEDTTTTAGDDTTETTAGDDTPETTIGDTETTEGQDGEDFGSAETTDLTIAIPFPDIVMYNRYEVGRAEGYYEEEGLTLEVITADEVNAAVVSGSADIGVVSAGAAIEAVRSDLGVKVVAGHHCRQGFSFAAQPDITELEQLDGTDVVLAGTPGDPAQHERTKVLAREGWDLSEVDVEEVFPGADSATWREFFLAGRVSLMPFYGDDRPALEEYGANIIIESVQPWPNDLYIASTDWISENPNTLRRFLRATMKSLDFYTTPGVGEIPANRDRVLEIWEDAGYDDAVETAMTRYDTPWVLDGHNACPNLYFDEAAWELTISNQQLGPLDFEEGTDLSALFDAQESLNLSNEGPEDIGQYP